MRIIAGKHRSRQLLAPEGHAVRPTTDKMRERVFSMLMHGRYPALLNANVADLFAGTGALGLEALSRGASHVTFVEKSPSSIACLKKNIISLKEEDQTTLLQVSARALPEVANAFDFIFMDPPYHKGLVEPTLHSIMAQKWLDKEGVIVCECATDDQIEYPEGLIEIDERRQGQQRVVFLMQG